MTEFNLHLLFVPQSVPWAFAARATCRMSLWTPPPPPETPPAHEPQQPELVRVERVELVGGPRPGTPPPHEPHQPGLVFEGQVACLGGPRGLGRLHPMSPISRDLCLLNMSHVFVDHAPWETATP